ncbi:hypothetical protein ASD65_16510 [Microbacterium sp. Root61]|uniref:hypothetical protein n=1 Tax=Microbacterium sp. Root61 TaxID=1736570 RepID=UPI0007002B36|nr:hypothetical protein [Microbacterium sp. Root61]KRA22120.1 hypothetical protein ASD65_16510 [Microbacterium sp. Root61]
MSGIRVESDNRELEQMFRWAARTAALAVVGDGESGPLDVSERHRGPYRHAPYRASYRAGYAHRSGYYLRDFAHQALGAQLLGWQRHNAGMLAALLATATPEHGGWPVWALNFDGETPLAIDYRGPTEFVREVPAIFEMVELIHTLYRWTGDPALLEHRDFWRHTLGPFVAANDRHRPNGVVEGSGLGIFEGAASYNEHPTARFREAGDGFAAQYAATRHAAALERADGDPVAAEDYDRIADGLAAYFRDTWSRAVGTDDVVTGWTVDGDPVTTWGRETTWFMPLKGLSDGDPREHRLLDDIDRLCADPAGAPANIEALTYVPDLYLRHGDADTAWRWMQRIYALRDEPHDVPEQGRNGTYPEVSFTLVGQIAAGFLGLRPDAARGTMTTRPALPAGVSRLAAFDIPFGDGTIDVGADAGALWLRNGTTEPLRWQIVTDADPGFRDPHLDGDGTGATLTVAPGERRALPAA